MPTAFRIVDDHTELTNIGVNTHEQIDSHIADLANPHQVTYAQLGDAPAGFSGDHADLTNVLPSQHHARYLDSEAVAAMGLEDNANPLNHARYTDAEAVSAVGADGGFLLTSGATVGAVSQAQEFTNSVHVMDRLGVGTDAPGYGLHVYGDASANSCIRVDRASGAYGPSIEMAEAGIPVWYFKVDATGLNDGGFFLNNAEGTPALFVTQSLKLGINETSPGAQLHVKAGSATTIGSIFQAAAGQSANLTEWRDSAGTVLSSIGKGGELGLGVNAVIDGAAKLYVADATDSRFVVSSQTSNEVGFRVISNGTSFVHIDAPKFGTANFGNISIAGSGGSLVIGANAIDETADGVLGIANGTAPAAGTANQSYLYAKDVSASSEMHVMDEAGNETQISPHDPETGEYIFLSRNVHTGVEKRIDMERMVKAFEKLTGESFMTITQLPH